MKNSKIYNAFAFICFTILFAFIIACQKDTAATENQQQEASQESSCEPVSQADLDLHNRVMTQFLEGRLDASSHESLIAGTVAIVEQDRGTRYDREVVMREATNYLNEYGGLDSRPLIDKFYRDSKISGREYNALINIDATMSSASLETLDECLEQLNSVEVDFIDNNRELQSCEKIRLKSVLAVCKNSAGLYFRYISNGDIQLRGGFFKCIKKNLWKILLADGVGAIQGGAACLIWPPSCAILLPVLMAIGSGAAIAFFCG